MGVNLLGPKRLRQLRFAVADASVDHAFVLSHHQHWVTWFVTADHRHGWHDSRTGEYAFMGPDAEECWSSCRRFPDHEARSTAQQARRRTVSWQ